MKGLPKLPTRPVPAKQREWFARWLNLWRIEQSMPEMEVPRAKPLDPESGLILPSIPYSTELLSLGQIRLLAPHLTPESGEPVYVAVFSEWRPAGFLVAPFSRFPVPSLPGEWHTGWKEPRLSVLNLWNSYSLAADALKDSWLIDHFSPEECQTARAVFRHAMLGHKLDRALEDRIGPRVMHPADPRLAYQEQELARVSGLARRQEEQEQRHEMLNVEDLIRQALEIANREQLLAAADHLVNRTLIVDFDDGKPESEDKFLARADSVFHVESGQRAIPTTMWTLEDVSEDDARTFAGAEVWFVDTGNKILIAEGAVDESGRIISVRVIHPEELKGRPFDAGNMLLLVIVKK